LCDPCIPEPTPETGLVDIVEAEMDLVDPEDWSVPDPSCFEQEPVASQGQEDEVNDAFSDLKSQSDDLTDSDGPSGRRSGIDKDTMEAELDLVGSDESCIPVPSVSEMKA